MNLRRYFSLKKKQIIIFYGAHIDNESFGELEISAQKKIKKIKKFTNNIYFIIENIGISKTDFSRIGSVIPSVCEKDVFDFISDFQESIYENYINNDEPFFEIVLNDVNIRLDLPEFFLRLVDFAVDNRLEIYFEKLSYEDHLKVYDYEPPASWRLVGEAIPEFEAKYGCYPSLDSDKFWNFYKKITFEKWMNDTIFRERSFINQIKTLSENNPNHSFVIVRGSLHKRYFKDIKIAFRNEFKVKKIEYGKQIDDITIPI